MDSGFEQQWKRIGSCLAREFNLAGLFGVDAVLSGGVVRPVEVNPRYTASVEILERGTAANFVQFHVDACRDGALPDDARVGVSECCGKAILFARRDVTIPAELTAAAVAANRATAWPVYADIPQAGLPIRAGRPVMTVLASGKDAGDVEQNLMELASQAESLLFG
jgi:predicted ATP-grasp superfamily ATP-dependent carboligase